MTDRFYKLLLAALILLPNVAWPQDKELPDTLTAPRCTSFEHYRPLGETRVWTFVTRDTTIGQLVSTVEKTTTIDDRLAFVINEKLSIDYARPENPMVFDIEGEHYVSNEGFYLGDKLDIHINNNTEKFDFKLKKGVLEGYFTRSGEKVKKTVPFQNDLFAWENYFVDQLELYLAFKDIKVGDTLRDSIYAPQSMYKTELEGTVDDFLYKELYRNKFDSVYQIHLTQPLEFYLFLTPDKRLVRADYPQSRIRAYLDLVRKKPQTESIKPKFTLVTFLSTLPSYIFYLIIMGLSLLFLVRRAFKWKKAYPALVAGVAIYFLMFLTQFPIQQFVITRWMLPSVAAGGSLYGWGLVPALTAGVVQEIVKLAAILLLLFWLNPRPERFIYIGAFCGAGFGFMEAAYLASPSGIIGMFSWPLLENSFLILFHTVSGTMLGYAATGGKERIIGFTAGLIVFNTVLRYLPVFVRQKVVPVEFMYFVFAFVTLLVLTLALLILRRKQIPRVHSE
jgi:hypothetical protein